MNRDGLNAGAADSKKRSVKKIKYPNRHFSFWQRFLTPIFYFIFNIRAVNKKILPKNGPLVVCSNHLSYIDPLALSVVFNRSINFIAKVQLYRNKLLGKILKLLGVIEINRDDPSREVFRTTTDILKAGGVVGIYPEGTRSKDGDAQDGKAGVGLIVALAKAPVLICAVSYPKNPGLFRRTVVAFGDIIPAEELLKGSGKQAYSECAELIMEKILKLKEKLEKH